MKEEHTLSLEELGKIKTVKVYNQAYVDKQQERIVELEKENAELKKDRDYFSGALDKQIEATLELQKKYQELEKQIEKMKCCQNCAKNGHICVAEEIQGKLCGKNKDKWEYGEKRK